MSEEQRTANMGGSLGNKRDRDEGASTTGEPSAPTAASTNTPELTDPTTWPQTWGAADIERFLEGNLKEGATVNYDGLAFFLKQRDFNSLKHLYLHKLAPLVADLTVHRRLKNMSQPIFLGTFHLITSFTKWGTMMRRSTSIEGDTYVPTTTRPTATEGVVSMVTCESGGGKTVEAIAAVSRKDGIVFYCLATDIDAGLDDVDITKRDGTLVSNLATTMERVFEEKGHAGFLETLRDTTEKIDLGIVVDEAGCYPNVVRALCRGVPDLGHRLGLPPNVKVLVAVAGTGIGCGIVPPGSLPENYRLHHVSTGEDVWKALTQASKNERNPLVAPIEQHARGSLAIKNPRFARLLFSEIADAKIVSANLPSGTASMLVESCLLKAATVFKSLNGLSSLDGQQLLHVFGGAVAAIQIYNTPPAVTPAVGDSTDIIIRDVACYIRSFGMMVDNAVWSTIIGDNDVWGVHSRSTTVYLVSPPKGRYTLSVAQSAIFLLLLGLVPARSEVSGETLESAVTTLFPLLISAYRDRTVGEMLSVFGGACVDSTPIHQGSRFLNVRIVRYSGNGEGVLRDVDNNKMLEKKEVKNPEVVDPTRACVFVNGPKYPFADVVVAIPNAALILVQCKDYVTRLTDTLILEEMHKMGHPLGKAASQDKHITTQKETAALAKAFNVPGGKITYMFIGAQLPAEPYTARANVCFGAISKLPTPLAEMLPFDTEKSGGPPTISELGSLPKELF